MSMYKKNVASQSIYFVMIGTVAPASPVLGATITAKRSIDGGSQAACTGTIVEDGNGIYHLVTSAADLNGNNIGFFFQSASGTYPVCVNVVTADGSGIWDALTANHTATGSMGAALGAAGGAILPNTIAAALWNYLTSAMTTTGSIGELLLAQLDTNVGSRLATSSYVAPANSTITAIASSTSVLPGAPAAVSDILTETQIANGILDAADAIEPGWTLRQALKVILAALAGKVSGAATANVLIRDLSDSKNRINATVDVNGNRTAVSYDKT